MEVKIQKTEKLNQLLEKKKIHVSFIGNGIVDISTRRDDISARQNISIIISQIMSDNPDLVPVSMAIESCSLGTDGAIVIFVSKRNICNDVL